MRHTAWITGRGDDGPYADQLSADGSREQAMDMFRDSLLSGEEIRSVREGGGGVDITLRRES